MKYKIIKYKFESADLCNVTTTNNDVEYVNFPAEVGNPNYDAFLIQANLTDKKVQALTPDKWYDFPKAD